MSKKVTVSELHETINELRSSIEAHQKKSAANDKALQSKLVGMSADINKVGVRSSKALSASAEVKGLCSGELLDSANKDSKAIHNLYRLVHSKLAVATEVVFLARAEKLKPEQIYRISAAVISAFDHPDTWWHEKREWSLGLWLQHFVKQELLELKLSDAGGSANNVSAYVESLIVEAFCDGIEEGSTAQEVA